MELEKLKDKLLSLNYEEIPPYKGITGFKKLYDLFIVLVEVYEDKYLFFVVKPNWVREGAPCLSNPSIEFIDHFDYLFGK